MFADCTLASIPSARWYADALEVSSSLLVVGATHRQLGENMRGKRTKKKKKKIKCGSMPNVMVALPNTAGVLCESSVIPFLVLRRKVWLTPAAGVPCINAANIRERKTWDAK